MSIRDQARVTVAPKSSVRVERLARELSGASWFLSFDHREAAREEARQQLGMPQSSAMTFALCSAADERPKGREVVSKAIASRWLLQITNAEPRHEKLLIDNRFKRRANGRWTRRFRATDHHRAIARRVRGILIHAGLKGSWIPVKSKRPSSSGLARAARPARSGAPMNDLGDTTASRHRNSRSSNRREKAGRPRQVPDILRVSSPVSPGFRTPECLMAS